MSEKTEVVVTDVNIKFTSMVILMVKASLAAIPAMIILGIIGSVFFAIISGMMMPH